MLHGADSVSLAADLPSCSRMHYLLLFAWLAVQLKLEAGEISLLLTPWLKAVDAAVELVEGD